MAKLLGLDKLVTVFRIIRENGGIINSIKTFYRTDDLRTGTLVGVDKFGNRYFENNTFFVGRNRWVNYSEKVGLNYDGSQVPAEWFGWLHYKTDLPPHKDPSRPKYKWMAEHKPNLSGTNQAYMPYSTTKPKIEPWQPPQ
ncbi:probable NADH dehydrogenase [ubiquinone] 1 alpha subcomplex subunit 12 isoform X1 [Pseudomyrmex gracilis]|uniref:probable NADH dehydrogenase [ubiquinone] 1 alpha subcomplex subunit 12 isoform X1 n=1 Tax=Pseudomyrmex gracilis TaxID=219809 RepID=UPI000994B180|nr:probable NADH dehydrogenase [ubiquinone] 1 alpha subcomplex subunit 12 isoform X1 [Pseudomyrmex gracilis]